jgi:hypothetical protein
MEDSRTGCETYDIRDENDLNYKAMFNDEFMFDEITFKYEFEELPTSNSQEKEEVREVERALEESKRILRERYSNPEYGQELLADTLKNLVIAVEAEKNQKKSGLNAIFPNAEYVYSEANLNMPKPAVIFQTPDQPELGFNSATWSDVSKQEPKIDMKEECVEPVSIWKDVSKLP